jgi:hypothetical protein
MSKYPYKLRGAVLAIPDLHAPWADEGVIDWIVDLAGSRKPAYIVQMGDARDFFSLSKYAHSLDLMTPEEELAKGTKQLNDMWARLQKAAPKAEKHQLLGNHDERAAKTLMAKAPELEGLVKWDHLFRFPNVKTHYDPKEEIFLGDICFMHGYKSHGAHARYNQCPTVVGHLHTGGVVYFRDTKKVYWELNSGLAGDLDAPVFSYRNQRKLHGWTQGCGWIDEHGPRFMSFKP